MTNFLLNDRKSWDKNIFHRKNFFHKVLQWTDWKQFWQHHREVLFEMPEKFRSNVNDEQKMHLFKKNLFNRSPWQVVSSFGKTAKSLATEKAVNFSFNVREEWKNLQNKTKTDVCPQIDPSDSWKAVSSTVPKKFWTKTDKFAINVQKWCEKKVFDKKNFHHKLVQLRNRKQYWQSDQQEFVELTKKLAQCPMMKWKKDFFSKKNSSTDLLGHNVSSFDNAADCCPKKSLEFFAQGLQMINETNKYFSKRFYVFKLTPWTRRMQCRQLGRKKFRTKTEIFAIYVQKLWEKKFLTKISPPQTGLIDKQ